MNGCARKRAYSVVMVMRADPRTQIVGRPSTAPRPPIEPAGSGAITPRRDKPFNTEPRPHSRASLVAIGAAVAASYVVAAHLGFRLAFVAEQVTTVWAPTGIALATLLLWGSRLWPAVWLGAFLANAGTNAPLWTAPLVATGNTLEAVVAIWALRKMPRFEPTFRRVADVIRFVMIATVAAPVVSATIGVTTLCAAGVQPWQRIVTLWSDWWLGDALGALVVAPAILTTARGLPWSVREWIKISLFIGGSVVVTHLVFSQSQGLGSHPVEYVIFPVMIAAAASGGPPATSLVVLSASAFAIWNTIHGTGPFAGPHMHQSLILLQTFMGVLGGTALLLAAAIAERETSEHREKDAAASLRESRDVLSLAMRAGSMGAWSRDLITNEVWWSRELEAIVGLQPGDFDRTENGFFELVHADDREKVRIAVDAAVADRADYVVEFRFKHASGDWRWMEGRGRAVYADDGRSGTLYGIGVDVTTRKLGEMALEDARNDAVTANQLKDQFLATLSHELRTPLNAILGYARMLQTGAIPDEKRPRAIEVIERNATLQSRLVEDLLDMSRITTGKVLLNPEPVLVAAVLREAIDAVKPAADAKGLTLDMDIDPFAGSVIGDATRLQQVFWNLLSNAVKFTNPGGRVTARLQRDGASVVAAISDTGGGIARDFLPFVFEPFRQADARLVRAHGGLGLGLAIAKQLVELHGGTIDASSEGPDHGATFTIRLPRVIER